MAASTPTAAGTDTLFQYSTDPNLAPHVVTTLAGTLGQFGSTDGTGAAARFDTATGVAVDGAGNVYVADTNNDTIRKITPAGVVTTLAGSPRPDRQRRRHRRRGRIQRAARCGGRRDRATSMWRTLSTTRSGRSRRPGSSPRWRGRAASPAAPTAPAPRPGSHIPHGVAVDGAGNVYVADTNNDTIRKITPAGVVTTLAGTAGQAGSADGTGAAARFDNPEGVAVDAAGNVYVADTGNDTIRKITPAGVVTTLAGAAGPVRQRRRHRRRGTVQRAAGVAVDGADNLYVADSGNDTIREITPAGVVTTLAGTPGQPGGADGTGAAARFDNPDGVAVDSAGHVYVADANNSSIRKVSTPTVLAQSGLTGASPVSISAPLTGLQPGTTYYFRAVATNPVGTAVGAILSFTTTTTAATTTTLVSSANPSTVGQTVTFTATVTVPQGAGVATGTTSFMEGAVVLGMGILDGSGLATFSTSSLSAGDHSITATYGGDSSFAASTSSRRGSDRCHGDGIAGPADERAHVPRNPGRRVDRPFAPLDPSEHCRRRCDL